MITLIGTSTYVVTLAPAVLILRGFATAYGSSVPENEETAFNDLNNALQAIMSLYQIFANGHFTTAELAIKSGGFDVKQITARGKQPWSATNSVVQGTIDLTANGVEVKGGFHEWLISFDGITFERMLPTTHAHTQVTGMAGGIELWFMHQEIDKRGPQGFDLVIQITVNR